MIATSGVNLSYNSAYYWRGLYISSMTTFTVQFLSGLCPMLIYTCTGKRAQNSLYNLHHRGTWGKECAGYNLYYSYKKIMPTRPAGMTNY